MRHWTEIFPLEVIQLLAIPRGQFTPEKQRRFCEVMIEHYENGMDKHPEDKQDVKWVKNMWQKSLEEVQS